MPVQDKPGNNLGSTYCHIFNRGIVGSSIFNDEQDYKVFVDYLKEYLSKPNSPESSKKVFNIRGRAFRGTPHQPKNYHGKLEMASYGISSDHFHLLVNLKNKASLQNFMRSLLTRYSMYFNRKYHRTGPLFHGAYKSILIKDNMLLLHLSRHLHRHHSSSYAEYTKGEVSNWINYSDIKSSFDNAVSKLLIKVKTYNEFVEKYKPDQKEIETIEKIAFEEISKRPESKPKPENRNVTAKQPVRWVEMFTATGVFVLLFTLGVRNIAGSSSNIVASSAPTPTPIVLSVAVEEVTPEITPKTMLKIKIDDESTPVNIREEPTLNSKKVGLVRAGDVYEFVSVISGWYKIVLVDKSEAFVSDKYVEVITEN